MIFTELALHTPEFRAQVLIVFFVAAGLRDLLGIGHYATKFLVQQNALHLPAAVAQHGATAAVLGGVLPGLAYAAIGVCVLHALRQGRYARCFPLVRRILDGEGSGSGGAARRKKPLPLASRPFFGASAVVTGGNAGIGEQTVKQLAALGFRVVAVCRNRDKAAQARARILADDPDADVRVCIGDLSDLDNVKQLAERAARSAKEGGAFFSLLVQNAGMFAPRKHIDERTGFDSVLLTNHLGPYLFVEAARPLMERFSSDEAAFRRSSGELRSPSSAATAAAVDAASDSASPSSAAGDAADSAAHAAGGGGGDLLGMLSSRWHSPRIVMLSSAAHLWATTPRFTAPSSGYYDSGTRLDRTDIWRALEEHAANPKSSANMYGISKACNAMHARLIAMEQDMRDHGGSGSGGAAKAPVRVLACSLHPGFVGSSIWDWINKFPWMRAVWDGLLWCSAKDNEAGAQTTLHCCVENEDSGAVANGGYHTECAVFTASSVVRDDCEVRAMAEWTRKALRKWL